MITNKLVKKTNLTCYLNTLKYADLRDQSLPL